MLTVTAHAALSRPSSGHNPASGLPGMGKHKRERDEKKKKKDNMKMLETPEVSHRDLP